MLRFVSLVLLVAAVSGAPCYSKCMKTPPTQPPCFQDVTQPPCFQDVTQPPCLRDPPTTTTTTTRAPCPTTTTTTTTTQAPCLRDPPTTRPPCMITTTQPPCLRDPPTTPRPCPTTTTTTTTTTTEAPCVYQEPTEAPCVYQVPTEAPCYDPCAPTAYDAQTTVAPLAITASDKCEDGWMRYKDSCYYVERQVQKTLRDAEQDCISKKATLFVLDSMEEYSYVVEKAPMNTWTWLGLMKESENQEPHFHLPSSISYKELPWLIKGDPLSAANNGWTTTSECAAHWNPSGSIGKYAYYYPCTYSFHYICERNSTLDAATNLNSFKL